jgi:Mn-dependent DtxR family transcriptional regulator
MAMPRGLRPNSRARAIYEYIKAHPGCARKDILMSLPSDVDPNIVSITINRLRRNGLIVKSGGYKDATWRAVKVPETPN